ncbi:MAG: hypothetical protein AVO35_08440 [Candidatus Aegiribacteria sp. MLS_C]|nr:MAG: hypothetical protein AVO35_08440 [Candidatus Aegiribacteria sp. MLS_C]
MKPSIPVFTAAMLAFAAGGCGSSPHETAIEPWEALLDDLRNAWEEEDLSLMGSLFREDFQHHLLEVDWDDYDGDGIIDEYWGLEYELEFAGMIFASSDSISFLISGDSACPWSGDSTGVTMALNRLIDLKVFSAQGNTEESMDALFLCRPDDEGDWYIWRWYDLESYL